ncbi:hypothetical protein [Streptomyces sp. NPDC093109]|uniref:hypothetical protein n=1 Tax=Streptomyces sp. NPDC093109 TaxID=3154977 RepID=UPI00344BAD5C
MRSYTSAERRRRAWLVTRGVKQAAAGPDAVNPRIDAEIDRIDARAADRRRRETDAMHDLLDRAKDNVAAAKAAERTATRDAQHAARTARRDAEAVLHRTEQAARRMGL